MEIFQICSLFYIESLLWVSLSQSFDPILDPDLDPIFCNIVSHLRRDDMNMTKHLIYSIIMIRSKLGKRLAQWKVLHLRYVPKILATQIMRLDNMRSLYAAIANALIKPVNKIWACFLTAILIKFLMLFESLDIWNSKFVLHLSFWYIRNHRHNLK